MFQRDYVFKGIHANIVTKLTAEINSETKFRLFDRNIDVFILAPIVGYLYGTRDSKDETSQVTSENIKRINFDQMNRQSYIINYNYQLIMLLHEKDRLSIEERLNRAFRYVQGTKEREECEKIYESYLLGGLKILKEKLLDGAIKDDDYIFNIANFIQEYNERYEQGISDEDIIDLCTNN